MKIKITADSTCDLSEALLRQWDISLMPMHILMGGESYLDGITVRPADVFAHVEAGGQTPKSAAANPVEYIDFFGPFAKEYDAVIHISVSAKLSSCYQNARLPSRRPFRRAECLPSPLAQLQPAHRLFVDRRDQLRYAP